MLGTSSDENWFNLCDSLENKYGPFETIWSIHEVGQTEDDFLKIPFSKANLLLYRYNTYWVGLDGSKEKLATSVAKVVCVIFRWYRNLD